MTAEGEQLRKIFVGGLNRKTTEETLKEYFSHWGTIVDCVIMREGKNGPSRGFGFVTFDNPKAVDECLMVKRHELDNWEIEPKRSVPRGEALSRTRKIFVGGLASTATESDVEEYFVGLCEKFGEGKVLDVDLKRDKENPSRLRGFAFVTFDCEEIVDKVCAMSFHQIKLKQCEVKKAESQATMRKKEEQEMMSGSRPRNNNPDMEMNISGFGGMQGVGWGSNSAVSGMNSRFGDTGGRGNFGSGGYGGGGHGGGGGGGVGLGVGMGGMGGGGGGGGFPGGNFNNPAAAAAFFGGGFNPAAFAGYGPGFGGFGPGFGFNSMGFGGFGPGFFGGFGGFGPGGFGGGGGGGGGGGLGSLGSAGTGYSGGGGSGSGYSGGVSGGVSSGGHSHSSSVNSYDKGGVYGTSAYAMADVKPSVGSDRSVSTGMAPSAGNAGGGYEGMTNPMAGYGGYGAFTGGFGGFPGMGDWSQFAAGSGAAAGGGGGGGNTDYQIGNYSQVNSSYGPANRLNNRGISTADKNNRGYRPY